MERGEKFSGNIIQSIQKGIYQYIWGFSELLIIIFFCYVMDYHLFFSCNIDVPFVRRKHICSFVKMKIWGAILLNRYCYYGNCCFFFSFNSRALTLKKKKRKKEFRVTERAQTLQNNPIIYLLLIVVMSVSKLVNLQISFSFFGVSSIGTINRVKKGKYIYI